MAETVLKSPNLDLKTCLETFKESPFTVESYLNCRSECIHSSLLDLKGDYTSIIAVVVREMFTDTLRQAFTIFSDRAMIYKFINRELYVIIEELKIILKKSQREFDRVHATQMWHSTVLAGAGLRQYSADFSPLLEDLFVELISGIILKEFNERLGSLNCSVEGPVELGKKYDLNKTLVLNAIVDLLNQVRLCPDSQKLKDQILNAVEGNPSLSDEIKNFAKLNL